MTLLVVKLHDFFAYTFFYEMYVPGRLVYMARICNDKLTRLLLECTHSSSTARKFAEKQDFTFLLESAIFSYHS